MHQWRTEKSIRYCIINLPDNKPSIVETKLKCKENAGILQPLLSPRSLNRVWLNAKLKFALALPAATPPLRQSTDRPPSAKVDQHGRKVQISHLFRLGWPAVWWQWWHANFASDVRSKPQLPASAIRVQWMLRIMLWKASYSYVKESDAAPYPPKQSLASNESGRRWCRQVQHDPTWKSIQRMLRYCQLDGLLGA